MGRSLNLSRPVSSAVDRDVDDGPQPWLHTGDESTGQGQVVAVLLQVCQVSAQQPVQTELLMRYHQLQSRLATLKIENEEVSGPLCPVSDFLTKAWLVVECIRN